jgi:hypothetical protein
MINCLLATQVEGQAVSLASGRVKRLGEAAADFVAELLEPLHLRGGHFTVVVRVVDGKGGEARQEYQLQVRPPVKPRVLIIRPPPGGSVSGDFTFSGRVEGSDLPVLGVQVKVDSGEWGNATGNSSWGLRFDTTTLGGGIHTLRVRAYDATGFSDTATITFRVAGGEKANPDPVPIIAVIVLIALVAAMLLLWKRRRRPPP